MSTTASLGDTMRAVKRAYISARVEEGQFKSEALKVRERFSGIRQIQPIPILQCSDRGFIREPSVKNVKDESPLRVDCICFSDCECTDGVMRRSMMLSGSESVETR